MKVPKAKRRARQLAWRDRTADSISGLLTLSGTPPLNRVITGDDSILINIKGRTAGREHAVDIYPSGKVVLIVREHGATNYCEFSPELFDEIPRFLTYDFSKLDALI